MNDRPDKLHHHFVPPVLRGKPLRKVSWWLQAVRSGHGTRTIVFVGQPKAGTTWMWKMLQSIPPYRRWVPDGVRSGQFGTDSFQSLQRGMLSDAPPWCTVLRVHSSPTAQNVQELRRAGRPYFVMIRDPRDIAVSWAYFIEAVPRAALGHDDMPSRPIIDRLRLFTEALFDYTLDWAVGWADAAEKDGLGMVLRYEDLLADPLARMRDVVQHLNLNVDEEALSRIVESNSFRRTTGREPGTQARGQHNRKGVAGDWKTHFDPQLLDWWIERGGRRFSRLGYSISRADLDAADQIPARADDHLITDNFTASE